MRRRRTTEDLDLIAIAGQLGKIDGRLDGIATSFEGQYQRLNVHGDRIDALERARDEDVGELRGAAAAAAKGARRLQWTVAGFGGLSVALSVVAIVMGAK